jgi:hypothetical protein
MHALKDSSATLIVAHDFRILEAVKPSPPFISEGGNGRFSKQQAFSPAPAGGVLAMSREARYALHMVRVSSLLVCLPLIAVTILPHRALDENTSGSLQTMGNPLTADQVVERLVYRNSERARGLKRAEGQRTYHLVYRGFPGDREATMVVAATYESPSTKTFRVLSSTGSKVIQHRVLQKLLEAEQEAAKPENQQRTVLDTSNYEFALLGQEEGASGPQYMLEVRPKENNKFLYRGKIWVDGNDFAVSRIEAEPAKNPSFWTKKTQIRHQYTKVGDFWLPARNQSVSWTRLGGHATLTIEYTWYQVFAEPAADLSGSNLRLK